MLQLAGDRRGGWAIFITAFSAAYSPTDRFSILPASEPWPLRSTQELVELSLPLDESEGVDAVEELSTEGGI